MILDFKEKSPSICDSCFVAPDAIVSGDVSLGKSVTVLFGAVLRGDLEPIIVGEGSNIQDRVVIHTSVNRCPTIIGKGVSVGHSAILHGARVEDESLVGMGAIILDEAVIPKHSLVGAGALVTEAKTFPEGHLILGSPAKAVRPLSDKEIEAVVNTGTRYQQVGREYARQVELEINS